MGLLVKSGRGPLPLLKVFFFFSVFWDENKFMSEKKKKLPAILFLRL